MGKYREQHPKVNPPHIAICPHCGNKTPHKLLHRQDFYVDIEENMFDECWWAILRCSTCGELSLYKDHWDKTRSIWTSKLIYPVPIIAPVEASQDVQRLFQEAVKIKHIAPSLCAVGIRKCLEALCKDKGATKKDLSSNVRELASKGILPEILVQMMDSSRIIGNLGAHAGSSEVTEDDANVLIDFCLAILEYVYVAPSKIASVQRRLDSLKAD
jgi:hypothetical protein